MSYKSIVVTSCKLYKRACLAPVVPHFKYSSMLSRPSHSQRSQEALEEQKPVQEPAKDPVQDPVQQEPAQQQRQQLETVQDVIIQDSDPQDIQADEERRGFTKPKEQHMADSGKWA